MTLSEINNLDKRSLQEALIRCCGSKNWVEKMSARFPFDSQDRLLQEAEKNWYECDEADWREAFTHHPKIGDINALREKFASTSKWAEGEQAAVKQAAANVLQALAEGNKQYEEKFGYIFIVCATGKTAEEMLVLLED